MPKDSKMTKKFEALKKVAEQAESDAIELKMLRARDVELTKACNAQLHKLTNLDLCMVHLREILANKKMGDAEKVAAFKRAVDHYS